MSNVVAWQYREPNGEWLMCNAATDIYYQTSRYEMRPLYTDSLDLDKEFTLAETEVVLHTRHLYDLGIKIEQLANELDEALTVCERLLKEKADRGIFP